MFKVRKGEVVKTVKSELELAMYISAGWSKEEEKPKYNSIKIKEEKKND